MLLPWSTARASELVEVVRARPTVLQEEHKLQLGVLQAQRRDLRAEPHVFERDQGVGELHERCDLYDVGGRCQHLHTWAAQ